MAIFNSFLYVYQAGYSVFFRRSPRVHRWVSEWRGLSASRRSRLRLKALKNPRAKQCEGRKCCPSVPAFMGMGHTKKPIGYGSSSFTSESLRMIKHSFTIVPPGASDISEGFSEDLEGFIETNFEDRNPIPVPDFEYLVAHST